MIEASDPVNRRSPPWWEIPGGGVDPGEQTADTAARELWEEAGIREAAVGPVVWTQTVNFNFGGWQFDQDEWIHVARCDGSTKGPGALEALEVLAFTSQRWWDPEEILATRPRTIPYRLAEFLPAVLDQLPNLHTTAESPVDISPDADHVLAWRNVTKSDIVEPDPQER